MWDSFRPAKIIKLQISRPEYQAGLYSQPAKSRKNRINRSKNGTGRRAKHGTPAKRPTAGSELCERLRRVSVSEGSINLTPPFCGCS